MTALDLREIPNPGIAGQTRDLFELFARDFLLASGYEILEEPARGPDGGKDLIIREWLKGVVSREERKWLVSVKHFAHSGRSVSVRDEPNIVERVEQIGAQGFLGFYSSVPSVALAERFRGLSSRFCTEVYGPARIIYELSENEAFRHVFAQYLPRAYKAREAERIPLRFTLFTENGLDSNAEEVEVDLSSMFLADETGSLRIPDSDIEDIVCGCVLASALRSGNFAVLGRFASFRPLVWKQLSALVADAGLEGGSLASEIETATDPIYLRLLIALGGLVRSEEVATAICKRLLVDGRFEHRVIRDINATVMPFYDVVRDALPQQTEKACPVLEAYIATARAKGKWTEKRLLESALRKVRQEPQNPPTPPDGWRRR